jgi:hypothetical protein
MYKPQPEQVIAALNDVFYEIDVLLQTTQRAYSNGFVTPVLLESRLLHTRNLIDFFEHEVGKREKDDVLAEDYGFSHREIMISDSDRQRLNKSLSHITYERVALREQGTIEWPIKDTLLPLLDPCEEFLQHLIDTFLQEEKAAYKQEASLRIEYIKSLRRVINTYPEPVHPVLRTI